MTHEQLREALQELEYINLEMHEQATRPMHTPSAVSVFKWSERLRNTREALAALEREGAGEQGWYCAHCQKAVQPVDVTYEEAHTECGRIITNDTPPATLPRTAAAVQTPTGDYSKTTIGATPPAAEREGAVDPDCVICPGCAHQFQAIPVSVQKRLHADAQDAARYRWLRDQTYDEGLVLIAKDSVIPRFVNYASAIDNYIDAAIDKQRAGG